MKRVEGRMRYIPNSERGELSREYGGLLKNLKSSASVNTQTLRMYIDSGIQTEIDADEFISEHDVNPESLSDSAIEDYRWCLDEIMIKSALGKYIPGLNEPEINVRGSVESQTVFADGLENLVENEEERLFESVRSKDTVDSLGEDWRDLRYSAGKIFGGGFLGVAGGMLGIWIGNDLVESALAAVATGYVTSKTMEPLMKGTVDKIADLYVEDFALPRLQKYKEINDQVQNSVYNRP